MKNLNEKGYMDLPVINPKTGETFDSKTTRVTSYYKTYTASNIVYKREYTVTYNKVIIKPKQTTYYATKDIE